MDNIFVLKVGGSVISTSEENIFDVNAANNIVNKLKSFISENKFVLVLGGGSLARKYQAITKTFTNDHTLIDWAGTSACNMNATMMRCLLGDLCEDRAVVDLQVTLKDEIKFDKPFLCFGAADPGVSSDTDAIYAALRTNSKTIISLKNVDGVYDSNPNENPNAKRFNSISWEDYRRDILKTDVFTPKMAVPVDPIASKLAQENKMKFIICNGNDLDNLGNIIESKEFVGTTIG